LTGIAPLHSQVLLQVLLHNSWTVEITKGQLSSARHIYDGAHIYNDENIANLVKEHPPKPAAREDVYIAASTNVKRSDLKLAADV